MRELSLSVVITRLARLIPKKDSRANVNLKRLQMRRQKRLYRVSR